MISGINVNMWHWINNVIRKIKLQNHFSRTFWHGLYQLQKCFIFFIYSCQAVKLSFIALLSCFSICCLALSNNEGIQTYQKNVHLFPEHKQQLADDITRYHMADNLWDALREDFALNHYEEHPAVQEKIRWFLNNQEFVMRSATRAAPYLYYISKQVKKRHLPTELVLLPIIESGYNPFSLSNMGAAGIWQLMPGTATGLGVKRDGWYDGRRDVIASTRAALTYLAYLQTFFEGNWLYAIAAYNTGEGNVLSAIKRNIRNGVDTDFWSLPVAQQTKDYVPSLLALAAIISHPERYPLYLPTIRNAPYLGQVDVGTQISLKYAAALAGITLKKISQLNPGFTRHATSSNSAYKLVLPIESVEQFTENLSRSPVIPRPPLWTHYAATSGDTLLSIAQKFNTTPQDIAKLNHLAENNIKQGTNLLIPINLAEEPTTRPIKVLAKSFLPKPKQANTTNDVIILASKKPSATIIDSADIPSGKYNLQPGDTIYIIRKKDTLTSIAKRFRITLLALKKANHLSSNQSLTGKQLIIPTHLASKAHILHAKKLAAGDTIYMVRRGDTIEKIAKRFKTTPSIIRLSNLMSHNSVKEGERLIIPTHETKLS